jgi:hypothetical protein
VNPETISKMVEKKGTPRGGEGAGILSCTERR